MSRPGSCLVAQFQTACSPAAAIQAACVAEKGDTRNMAVVLAGQLDALAMSERCRLALAGAREPAAWNFDSLRQECGGL